MFPEIVGTKIWYRRLSKGYGYNLIFCEKINENNPWLIDDWNEIFTER